MSLARQTPLLLDGAQGQLEVFVDLPTGGDAAANGSAPNGIVLIGHPHPLFGGTPDNKVVTTLSRALRAGGAVALRPGFRGVGGSQGTHDHGNGETDDLLLVLDWARERWGELPVTLAGFSFGAYVVTRVAQRLAEAGRPARWLVLVGTAAGMISGARHYDTAAVPRDALVIHGAVDTTVPLDNVLAWAEPLEIPVVVVPGADHFFHRKLHILYDIVDRRRPA